MWPHNLIERFVVAVESAAKSFERMADALEKKDEPVGPDSLGMRD